MTSKQTNQEKGALLEDGVALIERHILAVEANLKPSSFQIEARRIIVVSGVRHEIDIFVLVSAERGYGATFIFECKNWKEKVSKNEIIVFSEKIKACSAQRGFFLAPEFTADARAQAVLDPRVVLVTATAAEMADVEAITYFHILEVVYKDVYVDFFEDSGASQRPGAKKTIDVKAAQATLDGNSIDLEQYVLAWRDEAQDARTAKWGSPLQPAGDYDLVAESERTFEDGQFVVDGVSYWRATLKVEMVARIHRPGVRARVDVDGRGSALKLEAVHVGDGEVQTWVVSGQAGLRAGDV